MRYTEDHEWIRINGDTVTVGISDYATEQLGDVVFVELPEIGHMTGKSDEIAVVESVKAASEIYAPVGGQVLEVNEALSDDPHKVNDDPQGEGWFFKLKLSDAGELDALLTEEAYRDYVKGLA